MPWQFFLLNVIMGFMNSVASSPGATGITDTYGASMTWNQVAELYGFVILFCDMPWVVAQNM